MKKTIAFLLLLLPLIAFGQQTRQIKGRILDKNDGSPLIGATVFIDPKETQAKDYNPQGTTADIEGRFVFTLPSNVKLVIVSYLGYETKTIDISEKKDLIIQLAPDNMSLEELVVTGYQKIEKRKLTSSVATVKLDDMKQIGVATVSQMLEGQLAGVVSVPTSGAPGGGSSVKVRSTVTLNGNTQPLWVMDGIPLEGNEIPKDWNSKDNIDNLYNTSIAGLNPDDIKDITVLKDAAATAIYGARAANGVIIITTKKGSKDQPLRVNASAAMFVSTKPNLDKINLMNATQKVDLELQLAANGRIENMKELGGVARILDAAGERNALLSGGINALSATSREAIDKLRKDGTNWGNEIYRPTINQQYGFSISGGGSKATYYFSSGYYNEKGVTRGTGFERFNLTLKTDFRLLENLRLGASIFYGQNKNKSYLTDGDGFINPSRYTRTVNPYINAYDAKGNYVYDLDMIAETGNSKILEFNYFEEMANTRQQLKSNSLKTIFDLEYTPLKSLKIYTQLGLQMEDSKTEKEAREESYFVRKYQVKSIVDNVVYLPKGGVVQNWGTDMNQYTWKMQAEYSKSLGKHEFDLMAGLEMRGNKTNVIATKGFGYDYKTLVTTPIIFPNTTGGQGKANNDYFKPYKKDFEENRYLSYFATGSYTFDNRYTFFGSIRYDGTNLFGVDPKHKFNPMWSLSGAWNVTNEKFMQGATWLSNLRLRASYGVQGNVDRTTSPYIKGSWGSTTTLGGSKEDLINVSSPPNQNLRWETTYTWNTAIDFGVLANRLNATFEVYGRKSKNLITSQALALETGFNSTSSNYGEISSKGLELSINSVNIRTSNFRWETSFNIARYKDKVDKILIDDRSFTPSLLGHSADAVFGYKTAGLDDKGMPLFWKDGKVVTMQEFTGFKVDKVVTSFGDFNITEYIPSMKNSNKDVRNSMSYLGSRTPKFTGGFNNKFYYKNFDLNISCNFVVKQLVSRNPFYNPTAMNPGQNYTTDMLQVWSPDNKNGIYPAVTGLYQPNGKPWGEWDNYDDYRMMYYILDNYSGSTNADLFYNLDIWNKEISYFRVNSIRLGYSVPASMLKKIHLQGLRLSFEASNPFVIATNYDGYFSPETYGSIYAQPIVRRFSIGLNVTF